MKSKLSKGAYFYSLLIILFPLIMFILMNKFLQLMQDYSHWGITAFVIFSIIITLFVVFWGFFVEMNLRMAIITFNENGVEIKQFLGLGKKKFFSYNDLDGFVTKGFKSRGRYQEYTYLIQKNVAVSVFSSMYYNNYNEIRKAAVKYLKRLS